MSSRTVPHTLLTALSTATGPKRMVTPQSIEALQAIKGAYALILFLPSTVTLQFPRFAATELERGWYVYLGSARGPGGIRARLRHHFQPQKKKHWHIDHLTVEAGSLAAMAVQDGDECTLTAGMLTRPEFSAPVPGFGCSDCTHCTSHLLFADGHFGA